MISIELLEEWSRFLVVEMHKHYVKSEYSSEKWLLLGEALNYQEDISTSLEKLSKINDEKEDTK